MATTAENDRRSLEMGLIDPTATGTAPGSYVTQMRAAQNPIYVELGDGRVEGASNKQATPAPLPPPPLPQPARGLPPHYGIEGEAQCCLCSKIGRFFLVSFVIVIAALIIFYIYWNDIMNVTAPLVRLESHAQAFTSECSIPLKDGVSLNPKKSFLEDGKMNWAFICDKKKRSITIMRRKRDSWNKQKGKEANFCAGFGDLSSSFWLGRELLKNVTKGGDWNLRMDVKLDSKANFYVIYPKFPDLERVPVYKIKLEHRARFKSETPKDTNLDEKWESISKDDEIGRQSAEDSGDEIAQSLLICDGKAKRRSERGSWDWGFGAKSDDVANGTTERPNDSVANDDLRSTSSTTDIAEDDEGNLGDDAEGIKDADVLSDDDRKLALEKVEDHREELSDDSTTADGKTSENEAPRDASNRNVTENEAPRDASNRNVTENEAPRDASNRNVTAIDSVNDGSTDATPSNDRKSEEETPKAKVNDTEMREKKKIDDSSETKVNASKKQERKEINDLSEAEVNATKKQEKKKINNLSETQEVDATKESKEIDEPSKTNRVDVDDIVDKPESENESVEEDLKKCYSKLFNYAFLSSCDCFDCGGKRLCPSELTLKLFHLSGRR